MEASSSGGCAGEPRHGTGRREAGILRVTAGRLAGLRDPVAPALHGVASLVRRRRRVPRAGGGVGPARAHGRRVLPRDGRRRACARRARCPSARDAHLRARARRARSALGRAAPARSGSLSQSPSASGSCRSSPSARSSCLRTTSSCSADASTPTSGSHSPGERSPSSRVTSPAPARCRVEAVLAAAWAALLSLAQRRLSTPVRRARRQVTAVSGELELVGGGSERITQELSARRPGRGAAAVDGLDDPRGGGARRRSPLDSRRGHLDPCRLPRRCDPSRSGAPG